MKKHLSLVASAAIICATSVYADSSSIEEAFKNGKVSGDISIHHQSWDNGKNTDSGFTTPSIGLNYETDSINGFSATVGFRANHNLDEREDGDYKAEMQENASLTQAFLQYSNEVVDIKAGRQEIDLEWMGDYHDGATIALKAIPDTTIIAGYTNRRAEIGPDKNETFYRFEDKNGKHTQGYVLDAKYEGIEGLVVNPYYYTAIDLADFYGLKVDYDTDMFGITGQYATSSEDDPAKKDASIYNLELRGAISDFSAMVGYAKTDKDGGLGSITTFGDNFNPTEELEDSLFTTTDAKLIYAGVGYTIGDVELSALYSTVDYTNGATKSIKDKEITLGVAYEITEQLTAELLYTDVSADKDSVLNSGEDFSKTALTVSYSF